MKRFLVALATLYAWGLACNDDPLSHVYVAAQYDVTEACFGPSTSLGTIDTSSGSLDCAPTCLVLHETASEKVYVSTMCGPYPAQYDTSQTDPSCAAALAAWPAEQTALAAGTNSCASPAPTMDAGEGGADAADGAGGDDGGAPDASDAGADMDAAG